MIFPPTWRAAWPEDRDALISALAVAAAFRERFGKIEIRVTGDAQAAGTGALEALAADGLDATDLPEVVISAMPPEPPHRPIDDFVSTLQLACERDRRTVPPAFSIGERADRLVAEAALEALAVDDTLRSAVLLGDGLDGIAAVAERIPVTVVALSPLARRVAKALDLQNPVTALARPPHPARMPHADLIALDARPEDLRLAGGAPRVAVARAGRLGILALRAFGLEQLDRGGDVVVAAPSRVPIAA